MILPGTPQVALSFLIGSSVKATLAGARRRRSLRLAQTFSRSAPPTLGAWPCVFIAPSSCCAFASFVAFRNPRQRGESLEHCSCRAGKRGVSEPVLHDCGRCHGFVFFGPMARIDSGCVGARRRVHRGQTARRPNSALMDFRSGHSNNGR